MRSKLVVHIAAGYKFDVKITQKSNQHSGPLQANLLKMQENILFLLTVLPRLKQILCNEEINQKMARGLLMKECIIHKGKQQPTHWI